MTHNSIKKHQVFSNKPEKNIQDFYAENNIIKLLRSKINSISCLQLGRQNYLDVNHPQTLL